MRRPKRGQERQTACCLLKPSQALFSLLALLAWFSPEAHAWEIASFETHVTVSPDATAMVTETIVAEFGDEARHGIYRDLPIHYTDRAGQHFRLRLRVQGVTDGGGRRWRYRLEPARRSQRIRIGDPDVTLSGRQTYQIVYEVERGAVRFFPDHDECYWNLTGNEWAVPIRRVRAEIRVAASVRDLRAVAYIGGYGSTTPLDQVRTFDDLVALEPARPFGPYEGLTAAVAWAKGAVHPPSAWRVVQWWFEDNWVYGLPFLVLIGMTWLWAARGRDPRLPRSQVVEYEPPDQLTPAEMGTLMDERADLRDITATVVDLAVRGYLRIDASSPSWLVGQDYTFVRLKPWESDPSLKPHERNVLKGIFGGASPSEAKELFQGVFGRPAPSMTTKVLSELKDIFYQSLPGIRTQLYGGLVKAGYLDSNPDMVRAGYMVAGGVLGVVMWFVLQAFQDWHQVPPLATAFASGLSTLVIACFSWAMPRRTLKGARTTDRIFGFVEFLRRTDQDRIRRINDPSLFERCLPYALAFGVASQWARAFEGIYTQPPSWYTGDWDTFSASRLGYDLNRATASMGQSFTSVPRSSSSWGGSGGGGGGFSGGGGGGGGGGAW